MRVCLAIALALVCAAPVPALGQGRKKMAATPPLTVTRLPNGLTVVTVRTPTPGVVAYYTLMRVGSRNEVEPGHTGFAHFFEHVMFYGTPTWPRAKWEDAVKSRGLESNAFTSSDMTVFHLSGTAAALPFIIESEADRFQHLTYSEAAFQTEARTILGEYHKSISNPLLKMFEAFADKAFTAHTYKHTTLGFLADIQAMPGYYQYSREFFQRYYRPDNATIFIVGDFEPKVVGALVKQHYGRWTGKSFQPRIPVEPPQTAERTGHVAWPTPTLPRLLVGYHTPAASPKTKDAAIQQVLGPLLFGPQSPLYRDLVLGRQLCLDLDDTYDDLRDPGVFGYLATLKSAKDLPEVQRTIDAAIDELRAGQLDAKRLADVQSHRRYRVLMALETPDQIARALAAAAAPTGDPRTLEQRLDQIAKLTVKDLLAFAKQHLGKENRTVVTLAAGVPAKGGAQ
jgi:zinc protease